MSIPHAPLAERLALERGHHAEPHSILGAHRAEHEGRTGVTVRAFHPDATACHLLAGRDRIPMERDGEGGLFAAFLPGGSPGLKYRHLFHFGEATWERDDPYRFLPTVGELDLHLFNEGSHRRPWHGFGARFLQVDGVEGVGFSTWAPNAEAVSLVGPFTGWSATHLPMRRMGSSGTWELFVPGLQQGTPYKFDILARDGSRRQKADPFARWAEPPPATASRAFRSRHRWTDAEWMEARRGRDPRREPLHAYEVHLGSWRRDEHGRVLGYREAARQLAAHVSALGFTHVELMPIQEHPFDGSWGYQVTGYYAPTSRFGDPDDFRAFVDELHRHGIGVILDWVPAHFVKDDWALHRYDGTPLFEHSHPHRGEHPEWGTAIFNLSRHEVRSFLLGNALYWLEEMHVDGLRVDAVASMLYLDYSRKAGEWTPNEHGGNENVEAVEFLRSLNWLVRQEAPGCFTVAEESTAWPGVTAAIEQGGLGFTFKWNMGWMHDTLKYFSRDPIHRPFHHDQLTFAMLYENNEAFVNPLSHDEVVHGKGSLHARMPGDEWQKLANLRALYAYMLTRPGKKLLFMGSEMAPAHEWRHDAGLPWASLLDPLREGLLQCLAALGRLYGERPCLWRSDPDPGSFRWIDCNDRAQSVFSYERRSGEDVLVVVLNLTPVPREGYRVGVPEAGRWRAAISTDDPAFGGSGWKPFRAASSEAVRWHDREQSLVVDLPPLAVLVLARDAEEDAGSKETAALAKAAGIEAEYVDLAGTRRAITPPVRAELLRALGLDPSDVAGSQRRLDETPPDLERAIASCPRLDEVMDGRTALGVTASAWSIWRRDGWGVGDLTDVGRLAEWVAGHGGEWLGLSPLHLLRLDGSNIGPYSPVSRRWLHPLYLDVTAIPEFEESDAMRRLDDAMRLRARIEEAQAAPGVDPARVLRLKLDVLADLHGSFRKRHEGRPTARGRAHAAFLEEHGGALQDLATFLAIDEQQRAAGVQGWTRWEASLRDPRSSAVDRKRGELADRIAFHAWVQFELDRQLAAAAARAKVAGMRIGLLLDLAVGTEPEGADTWLSPGLYAQQAGLGSPPDPLGPFGQAWRLAPFNPLALRRERFRPWRDLVRATLRHAGALRIDHAFGLVRGFWVPEGREAAEGAYVRMPAEGMLQELAREAREASAIVLGEDLGTTPPGFDSFMKRGGLISTRLAMFERRKDGSYRAASEQPSDAMLAFSTHDLPPLLGWMKGRDLELRERLELFADDRRREEAWSERARDRAELLEVLRSEGLLTTGGEPGPGELSRAVHAFLSATRAPMVAYQLDDLLGETEPVNLPGVGPDRWPSWTRRQRIPLDELDRDPIARDAWP